MSVRRRLDLWRSVQTNPEQGGMAAQDACAEILLHRFPKPNSTFIDVGAHIGSVIGEVRRHQPTAEIIAVEAVPEKAEQLTRRFPDVKIHSCALGDRRGEVSFFVDTLKPGFSSLDQREGSNVVEITVPMQRLDDLIPDSVIVDFIKIDVEGAELGVLRGSTELMSRCRPVVLFESAMQSGESTGYPLDQLHAWFAERAYEIHVPNRVAHDGPGLTCEGFVESHYYPRRTLNYFAIPTERRIEVRDRARKIFSIKTN